MLENNRFTVITDTSANLPTSWLAEHNIELIPFTYCVDGEEFSCVDTAFFDGENYYAGIKSGGEA